MIIAASTLTRTFGIVAPTLTIFQCLAQANRIRTTGAKGVSLATWILSAFVSQIWFCYGLIFHVTAEVVANIPAITVSLVVAFMAAKSQDKVSRSILGYVTVTVVTILATFAGTFHDLRWVLAVRRRRQFDHHLPAATLVGDPTEGPHWRLDHQLVPGDAHVTRLVRLRDPHPPTGARDPEPGDVPLGVHHLRADRASPTSRTTPRTGLQAPIVE